MTCFPDPDFSNFLLHINAGFRKKNQFMYYVFSWSLIPQRYCSNLVNGELNVFLLLTVYSLTNLSQYLAVGIEAGFILWS